MSFTRYSETAWESRRVLLTGRPTQWVECWHCIALLRLCMEHWKQPPGLTAAQAHILYAELCYQGLRDTANKLNVPQVFRDWGYMDPTQARLRLPFRVHPTAPAEVWSHTLLLSQCQNLPPFLAKRQFPSSLPKKKVWEHCTRSTYWNCDYQLVWIMIPR